MNVGNSTPPVVAPSVVAPVESPASPAFAPVPAEVPQPTFAVTAADAVPPDAIAPTAPAEPTPALRIEYNVDAGRFVHLSVDRTSGETVSQVPTEEALRRILWLRAQLEAKQAAGR